MSTHYQAIDSFRLAMINALGCAPDHIDTSGKLTRFSTNGKSGDKSGWYQCWLNQAVPFGKFGDHRTGVEHEWRSNAPRGDYLSREEYAIQQQQIAATRAANLRQAKAEREAKRQALITDWKSSAPASLDHAYLVRKHVGAYGLRQYAGAHKLVSGRVINAITRHCRRFSRSAIHLPRTTAH